MPRPTDDARFWDRIARKYARDPITDLAGYERSIARTAEFLGRSDTLLEIGCGTGTTALRLAPLVASIRGHDVSGEMIAIAREKATAQSCGNAEFAVAAAAAAPGDAPGGASGVYDAVLAFNLLHLVADRAAVLAAVHRSLKRGGLFISKTPCLAEMNPLIPLALPVLRMLGRAPHVAVLAAPGIEAEIAHAGFTITARERHGSGRRDPRIFLIARKQQPAPGPAVLAWGG